MRWPDARTVGRWATRLLGIVVAGCAVLGLVRLVAPATAGPDAEPVGVRRQLAFLRAELDRGAGEQAQRQFPEGYYFLHALYGLTWVELGLRAPAGERATPLREARWALARVDSPTGRAPFSADLVPAYGVFYRGWTNWLRGGVLALQPADVRDAAELARFVADSAELGAAFEASTSPFLAAYPGQAWPVDSTVAVASLRLHDSLLPPRFAGTVQRWLTGARERLDPGTGLLPHTADVDTGRPTEVARATSLSIITRFLVDIDADFAREQYLRYRNQFVVSPLRLGPAVREFPAGVDGAGDVDSGPLVLGVSLSASAVTLGAAQVNGDAALAGALANYGELVGVPLETRWTKRYAAGVIPIGDAFLAWSKTARPWVAAPPPAPPPSLSWWWRLPLMAVLALIALAGAAPWLPALRRRGVAARRRGGRTSAPG
jgi:hypothetical protein